MMNKEQKIITILSIVLVGFLIYSGNISNNYIIIYIIAVPIYIFSIFLINRSHYSREKVEYAVSVCLHESEFNVIDQIEVLRNYFKETKDVIKYLTTVDSRVLVYVFNNANKSLTYKEFISGAIKCLTIFKNYNGSCYYNIDIISIPDNDRISTILSTLYMVSKLIDKNSSSIYIQSRQNSSGVYLDVADDNLSTISEDKFFIKLLNIFSTSQFELSTKAV